MLSSLPRVAYERRQLWCTARPAHDLRGLQLQVTTGAVGRELNVSSPEDTILMKLRWAMQSGGSEKQVGDAEGVFAFQGDLLDQAYLDTWAEALGVTALLADVRARVGGGGPGPAGEAAPA
jgi:hypothetical protein